MEHEVSRNVAHGGVFSVVLIGNYHRCIGHCIIVCGIHYMSANIVGSGNKACCEH